MTRLRSMTGRMALTRKCVTESLTDAKWIVREWETPGAGKPASLGDFRKTQCV
jgi:hypothetical protein